MTRKMNCQYTIFTSGIKGSLYSHLYLYLVIIFVLLTSLSIAPISFAEANNSTLMKLISENEDPLINANDLAFFLIIHDFNGVPKKDYVEVQLNNTVYKLVPNGPYPGLANVTIESR
jgi:hypothetical protein